MLRSKSARAVHADQPIGFAAGPGRLGQMLEFRAVSQLGEALTDRLRREVGNPQPLNRMPKLQMLLDERENKLAFPSRIASIDNGSALLRQVRDHLELGSGFVVRN
ncbi:Uncharacterised protein [Chlamydia abortus]|nr:Uncharacterised protein [Chlamydia abortus]